jgi:hypothetical protein
VSVDDHRQVDAFERIFQAARVDELAAQKSSDPLEAPVLRRREKESLLLLLVSLGHLDDQALKERAELALENPVGLGGGPDHVAKLLVEKVA